MKKKIAISVLLSIFGISIYAQSGVPYVVKDKFKEKFGEIKNVKWINEGKKGFEAEFKKENVAMSANFDKQGNLLEIETEIAVSQLPQAVRDQLKGKKIKEAAEIIDANGKRKYEAVVGGKDLYFDENGELLK